MNEEQKAKLKDDILRLLASQKRDDYLDISRIFKELNSTFDACYVAIGELENEDNFVETREHAIETHPKDRSVWITPGGRNFIKNNSYESEYLAEIRELEKTKKIEDKQEKKLDWELQLTEWQVKTFWWWFWIAIIGGICGVISLGLNLYLINWQ